MARRYKREKRYPCPLNVGVEAHTKQMIVMEAEAEGVSDAAIVRAALAAGLPLVRDRNRKRRRSARNGSDA